MLTLDGRAGGGQLVRSAVATSVVTDTPITMENVRGARETPGLRPQHVAAIETVAALADADTESVAVGAERFAFDPGSPMGGFHEATIGTAGSIPLVFDAVLPIAVRLDRPAAVAVTGGTDVAWSPPFDYLRHVKLPVLADLGIEATASVQRRGFYPSGGGQGELVVEPARPGPLLLENRGPLQSISVHSIASESLAEASVADRQADAAAETLDGLTSVPIDAHVSYVDAADTGSVIVVVAAFANVRAGCSALGEPGKPAEAVATTATDRFDAFLETDAAVDAHLADQLVPFLAVAGGRVRIPRVTDHVATHLDLVRAFDYQVTVEPTENGAVVLTADARADQGTTP